MSIVYLFLAPSPALARGIRNNNPGNLRAAGDAWQGLAEPATDGAFYIFESPVWGIRAMARVLVNYQDRHGLNTLRGVLSRWAPSNENDTQNYISRVADRAGLDPDQVIDVRANLHRIVPAIIVQENGANPYPPTVITQGIALA